jgi:Na+-transporting NADH:ubiquinone oxidoreductase subunit A
MSKVIKIKRGLDIRLKGKAEKIVVKAENAEIYAVKPIDFLYIRPKLTVKIGDKVKAGTVLFFNKYLPDVRFTSPVSGTIKAVNRGERRAILEVLIEPDREMQYESFLKADPASLTREQIIDNLLKSGLWPMIKQRPYGIIANPEAKPKSVFISAFDTSPLAPDFDFIVQGNQEAFQAGINALAKLTEGKVNLNVNADYPPSDVFSKAGNVQLNQSTGPHPAGNVCVQIHHLDPVHKNSVVWTVNPQDVITIGRLFLKGVYDASRIVALTGSEVLNPKYYKTMIGASIKNLITNNTKEGNLRYISGGPLTGLKIPFDGYIGFYDSQVTVLPEGNHFEFLGWGMPGFNKFSASRAFFSWINTDRDYVIDTNYQGGERAYVMTGQYEKVLPMDILPVHLIKSIMVEDIDRMENLGIYEVVEEDLALCEFVCTSKIEVQSIIRKGIDLMIKETS